jgi:integrase
VRTGTRVKSRDVTVEQYANEWLEKRRCDLRLKTVRSYRQLYRLHIAPTLGGLMVRQLRRAKIKLLLAEKRNAGLSRNTVRLIRACLSVMCSEAVEDGLIKENPASGIWRFGFHGRTNLTPAVKPFSETELARFLAVAERLYSDYYPLFLTLARTGCRPGEALALRWSDLNFDRREVLIERAFSCKQLGPTKSGGIRQVDMSRELASVLRRLHGKRKREYHCKGWSEMPEWVFVSSAGKPIDENRPRKVFARIMMRAALRGHVVYDLRHTFATLHLAKGHPITYVSAQLGHSSPSTTLKWYAHWLPTHDKQYADSLDEIGSGGSQSHMLSPA